MSNRDIKQSYDAVASHFNLTRRKHLQPELLEFKQYFKDGQRILDLGCGSGRMIRILKNFEIDYIGVDVSDNQLNYAKKEDLGKIKNTEFIVQNILDLDFKKSSFDIVLCIATFHHIKTKKDRIKLLKNIHFWLKPSGLLLMTNWNLLQKKYFKYIFNFQKHSWNDFIVPYKNNNGRVMANRYYHSFTANELKKLLLKTGFKIEKSELSENKNNIVNICVKK